ncbi:unnamed protein product [Ilex paraguariensis]|uniref:Leucine-rich repeat-containing N-terminal plant-type domain-containing protein n=1 Tax=Ilex paraguariensis TaxID=185542 RepID=A0ABC8U5D1_9AQUA
MGGETFFVFLLVLILLYMNLAFRSVTTTTSGFGDVKVMRCIDRERRALLDFKRGLVDDYGRLSSWGSTDKIDCCTWEGVHCSNRTGHVLILDLHGPSDDDPNHSQRLSGQNISSSLLELQHLSYLDLSFNNFRSSTFPEFISSLSRLRHLNLAMNGIYGMVPHQLGNLTNLRYLDLRGNHLNGTKLEWLSHIRHLRYLGMSGADLSKAVDWQQAINKLPLLTELQLVSCQLPQTTIPPSFDLLPTNSSSSMSLSVIGLSRNNLVSSSIYHWLFNLNASLVSIDLSENYLGGPIPDAFGYMHSLEDVELTVNSLDGGIPKSFGNLSRLHSLQLSHNNLNEQLPHILQNLMGAENSLEILNLEQNQISGSLPDFTKFSSLKELYLGGNTLNGSFPVSFGRISNLDFLDVSFNQISGPLPDISVFPLLRELYLSYNRLQGMLPKSIGQLSKLEIFDASSNSLEGIISEPHFSNLSNLKTLILSYNSVALAFSSDWTPPFQLNVIGFSNCSMGPHFPKWLRTQNNFSQLDISCIGISDTIPDWFWDLSPRLLFLNLSYNQISGIVPNLSLRLVYISVIDLSSNCFNGSIPSLPPNVMILNLSKNKFLGSISSLCGSHFFGGSLDLSDNLLSGELPDCWTNNAFLSILNLDNNYFSGKIPSSIGSLRFLKSLHLRNNNFVGELPSSLQECTELRVIDLSENKLTGKVPPWIGARLINLIVLSLRSNKFSGSILPVICHLDHIQILDLSRNNISGNLPRCFNNFTSLVQKNTLSGTIDFQLILYPRSTSVVLGSGYMDNALVQWKGQEWEFKKNLGRLKNIDLSSNKLVGRIPENIASLKGLLYFNLSRNHLTGTIIQRIGDMEMLECLDLSKNQLSGEIPTDFARLHFLSVLDLADNNLSGKIPSSTQLQSFNASSYAGNPDLCGLPLPKCQGDETAARVPAVTDHGIDNNFEENQDKLVTFGFYVSMVLGFILSFWAVFGTLLLKRSWQHAYFQFLNAIKDWIYVTTAVYAARLQRKLTNYM